jgi:hypothetical protein
MVANLPKAGELPDKLMCRVALSLSADPNPTYVLKGAPTVVFVFGLYFSNPKFAIRNPKILTPCLVFQSFILASEFYF